MSVVGARPNFMKIAPFVRELGRHPDRFDHHLVHTGQHYDKAMSDAFWTALGIPEPDSSLGIGSGTHAEQVGRTMEALEKILKTWKPDWVVVVGDVNATCAAAITAKKEHVKLAHIEAGLRSFDRAMPEEINRIVTDRLSDLLFTPDEIADLNLKNEGMPNEAIRRVGNVMIDTLEANRERAAELDLKTIIESNLIKPTPRSADPSQGGDQRKVPSIGGVPGLSAVALSGVEGAKAEGRGGLNLQNGYAVLTLHRPSNVDDRATLESLVRLFQDDVATAMPLLWTLHPRTRKQLETWGLLPAISSCPSIVLLEPLGYLEMLKLNLGARVMLTDSGGLQEECCVLGTPCITLRTNTERPVTLRENGGTAELAGSDVGRIRRLFAAMKDAPRRESRPPLWDGHTAERIVEVFRGLR